MSNAIDELLGFAGPPLSLVTPSADFEGAEVGAPTSLLALLEKRNGFYAFDRALHVLSTARGPGEVSLEEWNHPALWRCAYEARTQDCYFFAEDAFGIQFGLRESGVVTFDPETAQLAEVGSSIDAWARAVLEETDLLTGRNLAREWSARFGPIPTGKRLLPVMPFMFGGEFEAENLRAVDAVECMRVRAEMWRQTRDLPDGTAVELVTTGGDGTGKRS